MTPVQETENLDSEEQVETVLDLESEEPDVVVEEEVLVNNTRNLSTQEQTVETVETVVQLDTNFKVILNIFSPKIFHNIHPFR